MGFRLNWIAFEGLSPEQVHVRLGLVPTGETMEIPEAEYCGVALNNGWYVVIEESHERLPEVYNDPALSDGCECVYGSVNETTMFSLASGHRNGSLLWDIVHDSSLGTVHLDATSYMPACYDLVRTRLAAEQEQAGGEDADVDYFFDIPVEVAREVCGFRHDYDPDAEGDEPFVVLEYAPPKEPPKAPVRTRRRPQFDDTFERRAVHTTFFGALFTSIIEAMEARRRKRQSRNRLEASRRRRKRRKRDGY